MTKPKADNLAVGLAVFAFIQLINADESPSFNELPSTKKIEYAREVIATEISLNLPKEYFNYEGGNPETKDRDHAEITRKHYSKTNDDFPHGESGITRKKYSSFGRNGNEKKVVKRQVKNYVTPSLKGHKIVNDEGAFDFVDMPLSDQPFASDVKKMSKFSTKKGPNGQEYEYEYIYYYYDEDDQASKSDSNIISNEKLDKKDSRYESINDNAPTTHRAIPYSYMEHSSLPNNQSQQGLLYNHSSNKAVPEPTYSSATDVAEFYPINNGYTTAQNKLNSAYLSTTEPNNSKNLNRANPSIVEKFGKNKQSEFPVGHYFIQQDVTTPANYVENEESRRFMSDQQNHKYHKTREGKSFSPSTTMSSNNHGTKQAKPRPPQQHSEAPNSPRIATNIPKGKTPHIENQSLISKPPTRKDMQENISLRIQNRNPSNLGNAFITKNNKKTTANDSHNIDNQPKITKSTINSKDANEREIAKKNLNEFTNNLSVADKLENNTKISQYSNDSFAKETSLKESSKIQKNQTVLHLNASLEDENDKKTTEKISYYVTQTTPTIKLSTSKEDYVSQKTQNEKNSYFATTILTENPKIAQYFAVPISTSESDTAKPTQHYTTQSVTFTEKAKTTGFSTITPPTTMTETTFYPTYYATSTTAATQDNTAHSTTQLQENMGASTISDNIGLSTIQDSNTGQPTTVLDNIGYSTLQPDNNAIASTTMQYGLTDKSAFDLYAIVRQSQQEESMNYIPTQTIMYSTTMDTDIQPPVTYTSTTQATSTTAATTTTSTTTLAPTVVTTQTVEPTRQSFGGSKRYRGSGSVAKSRYPISSTSESPNSVEGDASVKTKNRFHPTERHSSYTKRIQKKPKDTETSNTTPKEFDVSKTAFVPKRYRSNLPKGENQSTTEVPIQAHTPSLSKVNFAERYNARRRNNLRSTTSPSFSEENLEKTDGSNSTISETKTIEHSTTSLHLRMKIQPRPLRPGPKLNISQRGKPTTQYPATVADLEATSATPDTVTPNHTDEGTKPNHETSDNATTISISTTEATPIPDILTRLRKRTKFRITETTKTTPHLNIASANQNRRKLPSNLLSRRPHSQRAEERNNQISEKIDEPKPTITSQMDEANATVINNEKMDETLVKSEETLISTSESPTIPQMTSTTENKLSSLLSSRRKHLSARKPGNSISKTST